LDVGCMSPSLSATIAEQRFYDNTVFMMAPHSSIIEAHMYYGIIIYRGSLRLYFEHVCNTLASGDVTEITFRKAGIKSRGQIVGTDLPCRCRSIPDQSRLNHAFKTHPNCPAYVQLEQGGSGRSV
jgi:hypothetical protein